MPILGGIKFVRIMTKGQGPPAASWMDIKTLMRARFVPPSYNKELIMKLQRLHQDPMSVSEYFKELESQMRRVEIKETNPKRK